MFASQSHLPVIHNCSNTGVCRAEWENIQVAGQEDKNFWLTRKSSDVKKEPDGGEVELEVEEDKGH